MIINGTKPLKRHPRKSFHRKFGGTFIIPDFSLDKGWHPDQNSDDAPTECTGYTVAKILADLAGVQPSPDFIYAATRYLEGAGAGVDGADFHIAMQAAVALGALPKSQAPISAQGSGERFVSDWNIWTADEKKKALQFVQNGTMNALGFADPHVSILSAAYTGQMGVSVGTPWYPEWSAAGYGNIVTHNPDGSISTSGGGVKTGIMPMPANPSNTDGLPWHNWVILGQKNVNGKTYAVAYPHQGDEFGDKGLVYFDRDTINAVMAVTGTGAIVFNPNAIRWVSLVGIMVTRFPFLISYLPQLLKA